VCPLSEMNVEPIGNCAALFNGVGADSQDLLPMIDQLEIQDVGELALIAWRVI
jgi:hypothetical protein